MLLHNALPHLIQFNVAFTASLHFLLVKIQTSKPWKKPVCLRQSKKSYPLATFRMGYITGGPAVRTIWKQIAAFSLALPSGRTFMETLSMLRGSCTVVKFSHMNEITVWFLSLERRLVRLLSNPRAKKGNSPLTMTQSFDLLGSK